MRPVGRRDEGILAAPANIQSSPHPGHQTPQSLLHVGHPTRDHPPGRRSMTGRPGRIQSLSRSLTPEPPKALTPRLVGSASGARTAPGSSDPVLSTCRRPLPQHHADQESSRRYAVSMGSVRFAGVSSSWPHGLCVSNKEPSPQKRAIAVASRRTRDGARCSLTRQGLWMHAPRADEARAGEPLQPRSRAARRQKAWRPPASTAPTQDTHSRWMHQRSPRHAAPPAGRRHSGQHPAPIPTYPRIRSQPDGIAEATRPEERVPTEVGELYGHAPPLPGAGQRQAARGEHALAPQIEPVQG